jgi:hypothetical protein
MKKLPAINYLDVFNTENTGYYSCFLLNESETILKKTVRGRQIYPGVRKSDWFSLQKLFLLKQTL